MEIYLLIKQISLLSTRNQQHLSSYKYFFFFSFEFSCIEIIFIKLAGIKVHETIEKELVIEPAVRWVGNPNISLVLKFLSLPITVQVREALKLFVDNN